MKILFFLFVAFASAIPTYVMMSLTMVNNDGSLNNPDHLKWQLNQLKQGGVEGVMTDVWWGIVETSPKQYNWGGYLDFMAMCSDIGLKVKVVMSFHQCGGNTGDDCYIPIPSFTRTSADYFYTDKEGTVDYEYISLGADNVTISGRTPIQMYTDYMTAFRDSVLSKFQSIVTVVEVGLGPASELRYPAYKVGTYPGVGEFQCYDKYMLADLKQAAINYGQPSWGIGGPNDAGSYNQQPSQTGFWSEGTTNNYNSEYGRFFLNWYLSRLVIHGDNVLSAATRVFSSNIANGLKLSAKVAGVHWQYKTNSHASECTAGYYNTNGVDAYKVIASMCSSCGPQELISQVRNSVNSVGISFSGENALTMYDQRHYSQVEYTARTPVDSADFTYLRLSDTLLKSANWGTFTSFVSAMRSE